LSGLEPLTHYARDGVLLSWRANQHHWFALSFQNDLSEDFDGALTIARQQVSGGANIPDVNMDEGMIDSEGAMTRFLNLIGSEPVILARAAYDRQALVEVIEAGLKCVQGNPLSNSISLKNGEEEFLRQARKSGDMAQPSLSWRSMSVASADS